MWFYLGLTSCLVIVVTAFTTCLRPLLFQPSAYVWARCRPTVEVYAHLSCSKDMWLFLGIIVFLGWDYSMHELIKRLLRSTEGRCWLRQHSGLKCTFLTCAEKSSSKFLIRVNRFNSIINIFIFDWQFYSSNRHHYHPEKCTNASVTQLFVTLFRNIRTHYGLMPTCFYFLHSGCFWGTNFCKNATHSVGIEVIGQVCVILHTFSVQRP